MIFRHANENEKAIIAALYSSVKGTKFCAWDEYYPGDLDINEDFSAGNLFVLEEGGEIIGAVSVNTNNELDSWHGWEFPAAAEFARLVIRPDYWGKGLSERLVKGVLEEIRRRGFTAVHISVAKQNLPARRLYEKAGFKFVGEEEMYGSEFFLCELGLEK